MKKFFSITQFQFTKDKWYSEVKETLCHLVLPNANGATGVF